MTIKLVRGTETAEITGDDDLIESSLSYQGTFERQVTKVTNGFYMNEPRKEPHA